MTTEDLRDIQLSGTTGALMDCAEMLREIAAQLAELNATLHGFTKGYLPVGLCATNDDIPVRVKE